MKTLLLLGLLSVLSISTLYAQTAQTIVPYIDDNWPDSRYTINADNTVTDTLTGLMWQRCSIGQDQTSASCSGTASTHTWPEALQLATTDTTAGFADWRLPNFKELDSIAALNRFSPAINSSAFPNTVSSFYWSSSPVANFNDLAWDVNFSTGFDIFDSRSSINRVRLVRGG